MAVLMAVDTDMAPLLPLVVGWGHSGGSSSSGKKIMAAANDDEDAEVMGANAW
eukprot:SAG25_NODE_11644_length_299_cov_1.025000_1_plen_53_part_00